MAFEWKLKPAQSELCGAGEYRCGPSARLVSEASLISGISSALAELPGAIAIKSLDKAQYCCDSNISLPMLSSKCKDSVFDCDESTTENRNHDLNHCFKTVPSLFQLPRRSTLDDRIKAP